MTRNKDKKLSIEVHSLRSLTLKNLTFILINFLVQTLQCFEKNIKHNFCPQKV